MRPTSKMLTICGWSRRAIVRASCSKRVTVSSPCVRSTASTLMATGRDKRYLHGQVDVGHAAATEATGDVVAGDVRRWLDFCFIHDGPDRPRADSSGCAQWRDIAAEPLRRRWIDRIMARWRRLRGRLAVDGMERHPMKACPLAGTRRCRCGRFGRADAGSRRADRPAGRRQERRGARAGRAARPAPRLP